MTIIQPAKLALEDGTVFTGISFAAPGEVEGVRHRKLPAFSVQYHPEASAGPHDGTYLFGQFREMLF